MTWHLAKWAAAALGVFMTVDFLFPKLPPPVPKYLPGKELGEVGMRWVGPYVSASWWTVGGDQETSVCWLSPVGKVRRKISGPRIGLQPGFAYDYSQSPNEIFGVNADWKLVLTNKPGPAGYHTSTEDSRTYLYQHHPTQEQIAIDVYVLGKLVGTVGPFLQYQGNGVHLGPDGSLALLVWKDEKKKTPQVVVAGPDGKVRFQADVVNPVWLAFGQSIAPEGRGVLVQPNRGGEDRHLFHFYTQAGKGQSLKIQYNPSCVLWLPGTGTALFSTAIGANYRFQLIDWEKGKILWDIPDPNSGRAGQSAPAVAVAGNLLLFAGRENLGVGNPPNVVRSIQAVDIPSGNVLAHWRSDSLRPEDNQEWLLTLEDRTYLMTGQSFSVIDPQEIIQRKNGWK